MHPNSLEVPYFNTLTQKCYHANIWIGGGLNNFQLQKGRPFEGTHRGKKKKLTTLFMNGYGIATGTIT